jgi:hypothetical protein
LEPSVEKVSLLLLLLKLLELLGFVGVRILDQLKDVEGVLLIEIHISTF